MNLAFIETFICVARLKSFRMAAERLNASQGAISNRIATLEQELGVKLLDRDTSGVHLTSAGRIALPKAEALVAMASDFYLSMSNPEARQGAISIGTIDPIAYSWLQQFLAVCRVEYPGVTVNLTLDNSLDLQRLLLAGEIDLALIMGPVLKEGVTNIELFDFKCVWVRSSKIALPQRQLTVAEMAAHPILAYSRFSPPDQIIRQALLKSGVANARIFNSNSFASVIKLALDGMGQGPLPSDIIQGYIDEGQLLRVDNDLPTISLPCHAVFALEATKRLPGALAQIARQQAACYFRGRQVAAAGVINYPDQH